MSNALPLECFLYWHRTPPPGLRFIRAVFAAEGTIPSPYSLDDRITLGHSLTSEGRCMRLFYLILTVPGDGCGEYSPDPRYMDAEAGDPAVRLRQPLGPMRAEFSPPALRAEEDLARIEPRKHFIEYHEREMQRKAAESAERERLQVAHAVLVATPPAPPPKRSFLQKLIGF